MQPGITIYFVRHGETDWNAEGRYQGQQDIPLNARGREQAARNGRALKARLADPARLHYVASPLGRTRETMEIMRRELGLTPADYAIDARLMELNYGVWEGQLHADLARTNPASLAARKRAKYDWRPDGGESYADLDQRVAPWLAELSRDTVVASHGGVSRTLRVRILGMRECEILQLETPQDRVLVLSSGAAEWL
jgi:probable phosphoglycerate mutase